MFSVTILHRGPWDVDRLLGPWQRGPLGMVGQVSQELHQLAARRTQRHGAGRELRTPDCPGDWHRSVGRLVVRREASVHVQNGGPVRLISYNSCNPMARRVNPIHPRLN